MQLEERERIGGGPATGPSSPQSTALLQEAMGVYVFIYPKVEEK